ncbi:MAG: Glu-tRNA(Gln) amidotransferase subunit GatE [bacterium]|nr:Glu-tRNA(Gln) amidotransferase subunit GatE [bacterium]
MEANFDPTAYKMKSGLEVHHQIYTKKKLFCRCPAGLYSTHHDAEVLRHMRPTLSELGEYDGTALMEFKTKKNVIYLLDRQSVCTYEMDDTPPFPINQEAIDIAIEIALLLNCKIVGEVHIARKQYLDGSIPTGFQRTTIIGWDGWIPYKDRKVGIIQLALEEDACREVSDIQHTITYRTDRLSMPLIEVVTAPDMKTPQEVAEVGRVIGDLLRCTGKVRRGIGSVRQDVNVSIEGGCRVEIKGVPRIPLFPTLVYHEAFRQHQLLHIRDFLIGKLTSREHFKGDIFSLADQQDRFHHPLIKEAIHDRGAVLKGIALRGVKGLLNATTQPGLTFAHEISERIRVIACLDHLPNLIHTEDHSGLGLDLEDMKLVTNSMRLKPDDCGVLVWGSIEDTQTAAQEIIARVEEAFDGVPHETRQARRDGLTDFERILPGPDRMYPDTDSPPTALTVERIEIIREKLPPQPWVMQEQFVQEGISPHVAHELSTSPNRLLALKLMEDKGVSPKLIAWALTELQKSLKRKQVPIAQLNDQHWSKINDLVKNKRIYREGLPNLIAYLAHHPFDDPEDFLTAQNLLPLPPTVLAQTVAKISEQNVQVKLYKEENRPKVLMGLVMHELRGRASGEQIWLCVQKQSQKR